MLLGARDVYRSWKHWPHLLLLLKKIRVRATDDVLGGSDWIRCYWCATLKADASYSLAFFSVCDGGVVVQVQFLFS